MAMRRYRRAKRTKRRRTGRGRSFRRRYGSKNANLKRDIFSFKRNFVMGTDLQGNAAYAPYIAGQQFTLADLPNVSEFSALFDRYRISFIKLRFYMRTDPGAQTAAGAVYPRMYWIKDYDDSGTLSNLNQFREHQHVKTQILRPDRPITIKVRPSTLTATYRSAVATSYSPQWRQWIDMATTDTPHYGIKWAIDNFTNTNYIISVEGTMWFQCKDVR